MKKFILKNLLLAVLMVCPFSALQAEEVSVTITTDEGFDNANGIIETMQRNLSKLLSEINTANDENRALNMAGQNINDFAKGTIVTLWDNVHFYCDDAEVVDRCWPLKNGYMLRQIPFIINPQGEQFGSGTYQECVVEFDKRGQITDFRFVFDTQLSESMERCGAVVELERKMQILKYCDRFRTAYCTKDIKYLEQVFSDDALIITGRVIKSKPSEVIPTGPKVLYKKQTKKEYLQNLSNAFRSNRYIRVKFDNVSIEAHPTDKNIYAVTLRQEWNAQRYSDEGYVFMIWDFTNPDAPQIHVRTWQPEWLDKSKGQKLNPNDVFTLGDFVLPSSPNESYDTAD